MNNKIYSQLASIVGAYHRCVASGNAEWEQKHEERIEEILESFPSGSGFDNGTKLDFDASGDDKLVFNTAFHHMNDCGMYDGWTEHTVVVTPSLSLGFHVKVTGRDRNGIKDYIAECFSCALNEDYSIADSIIQSEEV